MITIQDPSKELLDTAINKAANLLSGFEREFFVRVWRTPLDLYRQRLRAVGFAGKQIVLDAGCGNGQWTLCLSQMNGSVVAIDADQLRVDATGSIKDDLSLTNVETKLGSIEDVPLEANTVDAVFCYGVMCFCDHRKVLSEFHRVLRPGGDLYICTNGVGWYLHKILEAHRPYQDLDYRQIGIRAIANSIDFFATGRHPGGEQIALPSQRLRADAANIGFQHIHLGPEGTISTDPNIVPHAFFAPTFHGEEGVYEMLATKG